MMERFGRTDVAVLFGGGASVPFLFDGRPVTMTNDRLRDCGLVSGRPAPTPGSSATPRPIRPIAGRDGRRAAPSGVHHSAPGTDGFRRRGTMPGRPSGQVADGHGVPVGVVKVNVRPNDPSNGATVMGTRCRRADRATPGRRRRAARVRPRCQGWGGRGPAEPRTLGRRVMARTARGGCADPRSLDYLAAHQRRAWPTWPAGTRRRIRRRRVAGRAIAMSSARA